MVVEPALIIPKLREKANGGFTEDFIIAVAIKVARTGCTEADAVIAFGKRPDSYYSWKSRAGRDARYSNIVKRAREMMVEGMLDNMEAVGAKDWRMYNQRLIQMAPDRFSDRQQQAQATVPQLTDFVKALAVFMQSKQSQVIDTQPVKQIENESTSQVSIESPK